MAHQNKLPVLEITKFSVDFFYIYFCPENIKIAIDDCHDITIQSIQFL